MPSMAATPEPDLNHFDAVVARMPMVAEAVNAFEGVLRERVYYELLGILNPTSDDGGELAPLAEVIHDEAQPGETVDEVVLRLLNELGRRRTQDTERLAAENWNATAAERGEVSQPENVLASVATAHRERVDI